MDLYNVKRVFIELYNLSKVLQLKEKAKKTVLIIAALYPVYQFGDAMVHLFLHDISLWVTIQMIGVGVFIFIMTLGFIELMLWIRAEIKGE